MNEYSVQCLARVCEYMFKQTSRHFALFDALGFLKEKYQKHLEKFSIFLKVSNIDPLDYLNFVYTHKGSDFFRFLNSKGLKKKYLEDLCIRQDLKENS